MFKRFIAALLFLASTAVFAAVDVNKADQAQLETIKGIGPAISGKILDERKKGSFKDWTDLVDRVQGVGEGNAAKFSAEGLTVNGSSFSGVSAPASAKKEAKAKKSKADKAAADESPAAAPEAASSSGSKKKSKKDKASQQAESQ